jgi:hypothetical protein
MVSTKYEDPHYVIFRITLHPPQHSVLKHAHSVFLTYGERPSFKPKLSVVWFHLLNVGIFNVVFKVNNAAPSLLSSVMFDRPYSLCTSLRSIIIITKENPVVTNMNHYLEVNNNTKIIVYQQNEEH